MSFEFGVFDHIEPVLDRPLSQIYADRLKQIVRLDSAGFYAYHLAEHHTPAVHSLAPSQNVFLAAVSQRTTNLRLSPCVYVLPLHHPIRLIEEISMLDNLSNGRLEVGVGRGGILEAHFWGQESNSEINYSRYRETLDIIRKGLSQETLTYRGKFHTFDELPMRLRPIQTPHPPMWYMRNVESAAKEGMSTIIVGDLSTLKSQVPRYWDSWEQHQDNNTPAIHGMKPRIGLVVHMVVSETDREAISIAKPAWERYRWNLGTPRRLEAEKRGLDQFLQSSDGSFGFVGDRPAGLPARETRKDIESEIERFDKQIDRENPTRLGGVALAGSPASVKEYLDEYIETGANYLVCSFQWGDINHDQAMQSVELFSSEVLPVYSRPQLSATPEVI